MKKEKTIPKYNANIHHRRSIRLKGYDYSRAGLYFVTICVQNRKCLFGEIPTATDTVVGADLRVCPNDAGQMVEKWYYELEHKFPDVKCHEMVVMPNHFHCIIEIIVRSDLRVCPDLGEHQPMQLGEHTGSPLHVVIQWFKTMTTNEYIRGVKNKNWQPFDKKLWQRNYYEHIIRNENAYERISKYIIENPVKWNDDKLNPENLKSQ